MREIKFRAWDFENKRMWWNVQDAYDTLERHDVEFPDALSHKIDFFPNSFGSVLELCEKNEWSDNGEPKYAVMQFTGLKDKNGKDVYEGDVVNLMGKVRGEVYWDNKFSAFEIRNGEKSGGMLGNWKDMDIEVIGNIHEHPELLEEK
jgi:uncharacterized phage protein (TIGR01671 family)